MNAAILITIGLIFFVRFSTVRDMIAPSWGDSVHHTMIVQLILDHKGLFDSWQPYAPLASLTYHFGFHANVSVFAILTGSTAAQSVLIVGQILNGLAVLGLFSLVVRFSGSRWAGLVSLIFAGFIFPFPGFFVNWGRYTQLSAQAVLPALILLFVSVMFNEKKAGPGIYAMAAILAAGLILCHYRVALLAVTGALVWLIWPLWEMRKTLSNRIGRLFRFGGSAAAAFLFILPWLLKIMQSRLYVLFSDEKSFQKVRDIDIWKNTSFYFSNWFLILGGIAFVLVFIRRPRLGFALAGWCLLSFFLANSALLGLEYFTWIDNSVLLFALYIPLGIILGCAAGPALEQMINKPSGMVLTLCLVLLFLGWGTVNQIRIIDPFFQMMTLEDKECFDWIEKEIPEDAVFLVNGFRAENSRLVVGSDGGWWLPFYTRRYSKILPALYRAEKADSSLDIDSITLLVTEVLASSGDPEMLRSVLCRHEITHVFLGQKQGTVSYGVQALIPEGWLSENPDFTLLFQRGKAQVWSFSCQD